MIKIIKYFLIVFCFSIFPVFAGDMNISAPECFGTDFSNITETSNRIIECLNVQTKDPVSGIEMERKRNEIINDFASSLYANAVVTQVKLEKEGKTKESSQKSSNSRELNSNETQGQVRKIAERMDDIIKLQSSIEVFEMMLLVSELPYKPYKPGDAE